MITRASLFQIVVSMDFQTFNYKISKRAFVMCIVLLHNKFSPSVTLFVQKKALGLPGPRSQNLIISKIGKFRFF
jgi:hypothetical protein